MNIRQLETFVRIVELGSFAAAAEVMFTTQSTVSSRIRELERHIGVDLFDRSQHRAHLTQKGQELLPTAQQMVALAATIASEVGDREALAGTMRLGAVGLIGTTWLPELMAHMRHSYPRVRFKITMGLAGGLLERLRTGDADLVLVNGPVAEHNLSTLTLGYDEFVWMASPALDIPDKPLTAADLKQWPLLGLSEDSYHFPLIAQWFADGGAVYDPVIASNNTSVIAEMTMNGLGVCMLPKVSYNKAVAEGRLRIIQTRPRPAPVEFVAAYKRSSASALVTKVAALAAELSAFSPLRPAAGPAAGTTVNSKRRRSA
jgi:DNA-binding transcriptional LysR family regulator